MTTIRNKFSSALRKATVGLGAAALIATGATLAGPAAPAQAATSVSFCFSWAAGAAYSSSPVYLHEWNGQQWVSIRSGRTNASGCATFSRTIANRYYIVQAYKAVGDRSYGIATYTGWTPYYSGLGTGGSNLGRGYVSLVSCTRGLYGSIC